MCLVSSNSFIFIYMELNFQSRQKLLNNALYVVTTIMVSINIFDLQNKKILVKKLLLFFRVLKMNESQFYHKM